MDIELTGNETPEELEALIDGLGDVDISDVTPMAAVTTPPVAVVVDNITEETHAVVNTGDKKPEKAQITPEQINAIRDDFPGMAAMQVTAPPCGHTD